LHEETIARLTRKLEKRPARSLAKSSEGEEEEKRVSIQSEASDEEVHSKKGGKLKNGGSSSLLTVKQIQELIANAVKAQLEEVSAKLTSTPNLTPRELMCSACPVATNLQNSNNLMGRTTRNSM